MSNKLSSPADTHFWSMTTRNYLEMAERTDGLIKYFVTIEPWITSSPVTIQVRDASTQQAFRPFDIITHYPTLCIRCIVTFILLDPLILISMMALYWRNHSTRASRCGLWYAPRWTHGGVCLVLTISFHRAVTFSAIHYRITQCLLRHSPLGRTDNKRR